MHPKSWLNGRPGGSAILKTVVPLFIGGFCVIGFANQMRVSDRLQAERIALQEACIASGGTVVVGEAGRSPSCLAGLGLAGQVTPPSKGEVFGVDQREANERLLETVNLPQQSHS